MCLKYLQNIIYILYHLFFLITITIITNAFISCIQNVFQMYYNIIENIVDLCIYIHYVFQMYYNIIENIVDLCISNVL
jgi:conjugal transfer/entry exclusion protein